VQSSAMFFQEVIMSHHPTSEHQCTSQRNSLNPDRNRQASTKQFFNWDIKASIS